MNQEEKILEFDKIKELWLAYAMTEQAKTKIREIVPYLWETELIAALRETTESKLLIEKCGNPPLVSLSGMDEVLMVVSKEDCLSAAQLELVKAALVAVRRMKDYLERGKAYDISLAYYAENLDALDDLRREIEQAVWNEQVVDNASSHLQQLRRNIQNCEDKMREKAEQIMRSNKECMSDSFSTIRNGRVCVPVKKEYRFRIQGSVIDKSATGNTLFIEPVASAKYYEELQQLRIDEEDEVRRILYTLTGLVELYQEALRQDIQTLEKLDFAFSKGKLSLDYEGTAPGIIRERAIRLKNAKHPLLEKNRCVPLQFSIGGDINGIIITGPNTGGKTVAIKTVALCAMMAQCGLHVPAESAELCMFSNILCDIGDGQNLSENLSTFSAHITNVLDILKRVNPESLVIMDELGSGTDPQEGMGIAVAILEELKKSGALYLVTTHYPEIKSYAEREEGVINARMTFDPENFKPLYRMVIGEAGESCALHIAKRLGMPNYMLKRAAEAAYNITEEDKCLSVDENAEKKAQDAQTQCEGERVLQKNEPENMQKEMPVELTKLLDSLEDEPVEQKKSYPRLQKQKPVKQKKQIPFKRGDSVMVYPDEKIGIVFKEANEKGVLRVQLPGKKIWVNHKRVKLMVPAKELYPEDYDFSIIFDTVEVRKLRHDMERKYTEGEIHLEE